MLSALSCVFVVGWFSLIENICYSYNILYTHTHTPNVYKNTPYYSESWGSKQFSLFQFNVNVKLQIWHSNHSDSFLHKDLCTCIHLFSAFNGQKCRSYEEKYVCVSCLSVGFCIFMRYISDIPHYWFISRESVECHHLRDCTLSFGYSNVSRLYVQYSLCSMNDTYWFSVENYVESM